MRCRKLSHQIKLLTEAFQLTQNGEFIACAFSLIAEMHPAEAAKEFNELQEVLEAEEAREMSEVG